MHRHGKTKTGKERYKCPICFKTSTIHREDLREKHREQRLVSWLTGHQTKTEIAKELGLTRRALTKEFHHLFSGPPFENKPSSKDRSSVLVIDGTYAHGTDTCVLIALDEKDNIFWKFAKRERKVSWKDFLSSFPEPDVVVADAQKGIYWGLRDLWGEDMAFQRCQFHLVQLAQRHITRKPKEERAKELHDILMRLKLAKTEKGARDWKTEYLIWEGVHQKMFKEKLPSGKYRYQRLRSARTAIRKALPHLFTFLEYEDCPNTTNDVEGWINRRLKEALGRHRGLTVEQQKTLVSVVLSHLHRDRKKKENPTRKFP